MSNLDLTVRSSKEWLRSIAVIALLGMFSACATTRVPVVPELRALESRTPVVVVPGTTGTVLEDARTGQILWGDFRSILRPPEGGYAIALPVSGDSSDEVVATRPVMSIDYGFGRKPVYDSVLDLMTKNGYEQGDLAAPQPGENFFFFAYDWRRSNIESARELVRLLENLSSSRWEGDHEVDLICQSNATHICRWALKFGDVSLEEAEIGVRRMPEGVSIRKVIFVGTAHGGSIRILREMNRGRRYIRLIGGRWPPEIFFTFPSLYQDLPVYRSHFFFDRGGRMLEVDLFDPENWVRFGWSIFDPRIARRADQRRGLFGTESDRLEWLRRNLDRARRFHRLLDLDLPIAAELHSIQNLYTPTADRALLEIDGRARTMFTRDRSIDRSNILSSLASAPGDGHANVYSQRWLSPSETAAFVEPPFYVSGGHFEIITLPAAQRKLLEILVKPSVP